eukprot:810342-Prorocentrum_minimum.AAC.1
MAERKRLAEGATGARLLASGIADLPTNKTQEARVYSRDGPIRRRKCGYILTTDQSVTHLYNRGGAVPQALGVLHVLTADSPNL